MFVNIKILLAIALAICNTIQAVPVWEDADGNVYYLVPVDHHSRNVRDIRGLPPNPTPDTGLPRDTQFDIRRDHVGFGQKFTIVDNKDHQLTANAFAQRDFNPKGPLTTGQGAEYLHKPSQSTFKINTSNTRGQGNDVSASGLYNFYQTPDKRGTVGFGGGYDRPSGGPSRYNALLQGTYRFN